MRGALAVCISGLDAIETFLDWLYPRRCGLCALMSDRAVCESCQADFTPYPTPLEVRVGQGPLDYLIRLYSYEGRAAQAVRRLKYARVTPLAAPMRSLMEVGYAEHGPGEYDIVAPVPIHWMRRCSRGFNQSERLVPTYMSPKLSLHTIWRNRNTRPQVRMNATQRRQRILGAFTCQDVKNKSVLLVDDVVTTGGTAQACAYCLKGAGALRVGVLAFCGDAPSYSDGASTP